MTNDRTSNIEARLVKLEIQRAVQNNTPKKKQKLTVERPPPSVKVNFPQ